MAKRVDWTEALGRDNVSTLNVEMGDRSIQRQRKCLFEHLQKSEDLRLRQGSVLDGFIECKNDRITLEPDCIKNPTDVDSFLEVIMLYMGKG